MTLEILQALWFSVIVLLLTIYLALDGFDLGAGILYPLFEEDGKKQVLAAISPFWDGNEVWLLAGGGAMFAAFPEVYATVFSGFYIPLVLVVMALIFRALAIDYRNKTENRLWQKLFDLLLFIGSLLPALLVGVAFANVLFGVPLAENKEFAGNFFTLLNPISLLGGLFGLFFCATHGAIFLSLKLDAYYMGRVPKMAQLVWVLMAISFAAIFFIAGKTHPELFKNNGLIPMAGMSILLTAGFLMTERKKLAFLFNFLSIALVMTSAAFMAFPNLVKASNGSNLSLTIYNSSSSFLTLKTMLIILLIGLPFIIGYNIFIYLTFRETS